MPHAAGPSDGAEPVAPAQEAPSSTTKIKGVRRSPPNAKGQGKSLDVNISVRPTEVVSGLSSSMQSIMERSQRPRLNIIGEGGIPCYMKKCITIRPWNCIAWIQKHTLPYADKATNLAALRAVAGVTALKTGQVRFLLE